MKVINSLQNEIIKYYEKLNDKSFRQKEKLFLVEGYHLVEEALKTNLVVSVLSTNQAFLQTLPSSIMTYLVTDPIINKISQAKNPQNIIGVVKMLDLSLDKMNDLLLQETAKLLVLDEINDPGNLGTLIRTAAGLGYDGIVISSNSVDLYNDKTLRACQGTIFKIKMVRGELETLIPYFKKHAFQAIGTTLHDSIDLKNFIIPSKFMLCLGNEARGMNQSTLSLMDHCVKLTMHHDVESLNVTIAGAIIMYEMQK